MLYHIYNIKSHIISIAAGALGDTANLPSAIMQRAVPRAVELRDHLTMRSSKPKRRPPHFSGSPFYQSPYQHQSLSTTPSLRNTKYTKYTMYKKTYNI